MTFPCDVFDATTPGQTSRFGNVEASFEIGSSWSAEASYENLEENRGKFMVSWCLQKHAVQPGGLKNHETYYSSN